jgi:hypothetical protein
MKNVWVVYFPCSGGGLVETIVRLASNMDVDVPTFEVDDDSSVAPYLKALSPANGNLSSRGTPRQFPYYSFLDMMQNQFFVGPTETTVYSIISPTKDATPEEIFNWADTTSLDDSQIMYVGFNDPIFCIVAQQKNDTNVIQEMFKPNSRIKEWNESAHSFDDLEKWQQREYLSMQLDFFFELVPLQNNLAKSLEWNTYTAEELYLDTKCVMSDIFKKLDASIQSDAFENLCTYWQYNQVPIHTDYKNIKDAIHAIENDDIDYKFQLRSTVYEAIIQRYLKVEKNINLKCYGLNTFPSTVKELQNYYE